MERGIQIERKIECVCERKRERERVSSKPPWLALAMS